MLNRLLIAAAIIAVTAMLTAAAGAGMNDLACSANGGKMPVLLRSEYHNAEQLIRSSSAHSIATPDTKYLWLCDRYYSAVGMHVKSAYSIGDVFIWTGDWILKIITPALILLILIAANRHARQKERNWKSIVEA